MIGIVLTGGPADGRGINLLVEVGRVLIPISGGCTVEYSPRDFYSVRENRIERFWMPTEWTNAKAKSYLDELHGLCSPSTPAKLK